MFRWVVTWALVITVSWHTVVGCCAHHRHESPGRLAFGGHEQAPAGCAGNACSGETATHHRVSGAAAGGVAWQGSDVAHAVPAWQARGGFQPCTEGSCSFAESPQIRIEAAKELRGSLDIAPAAVRKCSILGAGGTAAARKARGTGASWAGRFPGESLRTHLLLGVLTL